MPAQMDRPADTDRQQPNWRAQLRWFGAATLATLLLVAGINIATDPLDAFGTPRLQGFNALKPHLDHHRELTRWRQAGRLCPSAVILGNSRAEIGLDPEHPSFVARGLSAANQAVPGTAVDTAYQQLQWLKSAGCMPRVVVLGVEFFDFLGAEPATLGAPAARPAPALDAAFYAETVFSLSGLGDALSTVLLQSARFPATLTDRGFNPLLNYEPEVARNGHFALFRQRALENTRNWSRKTAATRPAGGKDSFNAQHLRALLALTADSGTEVHLLIYPYHAQVRLLMERLSLGPVFSDWKGQLVQLAAQAPAGKGRVHLWDFSTLNPRTLEAIPAPDDKRTRLQYYWEAGHFKKALGDLMLARMLGGDPIAFGERLDASNAQAHEAADRQAMDQLATTPSALRDDVEEVVKRAASSGARLVQAAGQ